MAVKRRILGLAIVAAGMLLLSGCGGGGSNRAAPVPNLAPSAAQVTQILASHPHRKPMSVPAGTYKGQEAQIHSVGLWSLILVGPELLEKLGYRLARALHRGEASFAKRLAQGRYTTARTTVAQVLAGRLHPGAARYYRQVGLLD